MIHDSSHGQECLPAPCIVDTGILVNKQDIQQLLGDLGQVRYIHRQGGILLAEGEGYVMEVFADPHRATLVANHSLYLNVCSFEYLELKQVPELDACFDLVYDQRVLRLIPLSNPLQPEHRSSQNPTLEAMLAAAMANQWEIPLDDGESFPC